MHKLTSEDKKIYAWQLDIPGFGEAGQEILKNTTALVSRSGGLGSPVAFSLASAGFGRLIIAHGGNLKHSDFNRQICMQYDDLDTARISSVVKTLKTFKPMIPVTGVGSNITPENADGLAAKSDIVFSCAPLYAERFALNQACVKLKKPLIDCSMYSMEGQIIVIVPGETPCLSCIYPEDPPAWKRKFPVFGAVAALAAQIGVLEGIKLLTGCGEVVKNEILYYDTTNMNFMRVPVKRRKDCPVCGGI